MKGQTYVILSIILVIIVAVFAIANVETVEVNYLFWTGESPLILIILFSVLMGGIITGTAGAVKVFQLQRENRLMKAENENMRKTLKDRGILNKNKHEVSGGDIKDKNEKDK
ncbi:LapA family protein [Virgibacillus kimchii]